MSNPAKTAQQIKSQISEIFWEGISGVGQA